MARYIDADKIQFYRENVGDTTIEYAYKSDIDAIPTADVRPERHGKWIFQEPEDEYSWKPWLCSACKMPGGKHTTAYCPHCGAKMDGKDGESNEKANRT